MPSSHPGRQASEEDMYNHDGQNLFVIGGSFTPTASVPASTPPSSNGYGDACSHLLSTR
jgi:hypothetical protein